MEPRDSFDRILIALCAEEGVEPGRMMSRSALLFDGSVFAFLSGDGMVFKLGADYDPIAAGLDEFSIPQPVRSRPPMKNWLRVERSHQDRWLELARLSLEKMRNSQASP